MNPQPKMKRIKCPKYLKWLRHGTCVICKMGMKPYDDIVPSHQTIPIPSSVKGTGQKEHDIWSLPVHSTEHNELEHNMGLKIDNRIKKIIAHIFTYLIEIKNFEFARQIHEYEKKLKDSGDKHAQKKTLEWITREWEVRI